MNENKLTLSFIYQLKYLFFQMYLTSRPAIRIKQFVEKCTPNWFNFGQQQDCSEYLIYLLDNLNEELKRLKSSESKNDVFYKYFKLLNFKLILLAFVKRNNCLRPRQLKTSDEAKTTL